MEVHDIVRRQGSRPSPWKINADCLKALCSGIICYTVIDISDQCKEIVENNRMGKTRDLFQKIRDTKGTFHAQMDLIKDRNSMDLTEAEDIKKRW